MKLNSLQWHVLDATADDWESFAQILPHVNQWLGKTEREFVANVIQELVSLDLLEEAEGRPVIAAELTANPSHLWFSMTRAGRQLWDQEGEKFRDDKQAQRSSAP